MDIVLRVAGAAVFLLMVFVGGPMLTGSTFYSSGGVSHDGTKSSFHQAMQTVFNAARKDSAYAFKVVREVASRCTGGSPDIDEKSARLAASRIVTDVFMRSISYAIDNSKGTRSMKDVEKFIDKIMIAKVRNYAAGEDVNELGRAVGHQNLSFDQTKICVFYKSAAELS
jgi:hypothetical protein